jgi:hypothetical protein
MGFNPNSAKHKAQHGGYKSKPTKGQVKALLNLYSSCQMLPKVALQNVKVDKNGQYRIVF